MTTAISTTAQRWLDALKANVLPGLAAFTIAFPIRMNSIVSVCMLVIYGILFLRAGAKWAPMFKSKIFILVALHMAVLIIGLTYTSDLKTGLAIVERYSLAMLCVALVYMLSALRVTLRQVIVPFGIGVAVVVLYGFGYTLFAMDESERALTLQMGHTNFTDIIFIHPTYLGIYLIFIFFCLLEYTRLNYSRISKAGNAAIFITLSLILLVVIFLRSQINLLVLPLLLVTYVVVSMRKRAAIVTFVLLAIGFVAYLVDSDRVSTLFDTYGRNVSTALENRLQIWQAAIAAFSESPLFGAGTGGGQININHEYYKLGYTEGIEKSYNAHNQYLQVLARNGLIEFVVLMGLLVYCFFRSLQQANRSFLFFMMLLALTMLAESCLSVQKGIVFFYFFASAFIFLPEEPGPKPAA